MPIIVKIASFIAPLLLNFISNHSDKYFEKIVDKVISLVGDKRIDTEVLFVDSTGNTLHPEKIHYIAKEYGEVYKTFSSAGTVMITGFKDGDIVSTTVYLEDKTYTCDIEINEKEFKRIVL